MLETPLATDRVSPGHRRPILRCLSLILLYPLFSVPVQGLIQNLSPRIGGIGSRIVTETAIWFYGALVLAVALLWERRSLASIGIGKFTFASVGFGVGGAVAMAAAGQLAAYLGSAVYAVCLALRAGFIEEIFYRGLAIEQLTSLTGSRGFAAALR